MKSWNLILCVLAGALPGGIQRTHAVGAITPFVSYEAEAGTAGGGATVVSLTTPPTTQYSSPELESSGHAYVRLNATGQYVEWTNNTGHNITAINVRACIPDAPAGGGMTATLDLYVNGTFRQTFTLTSAQTWGYEGNNHYNNESQNPADGNPRTFFDDVHAFITGAAVAPGDAVRLQKNETNTAPFYYIDVVDVEQPPAPLPQPANSLSITTYGAVANNPASDNTSAIQNCINAAQTQKKIVWIPSGTFYVKTLGGLNARGITIQGAGMWYSTIYRSVPLPNSTPLGAIFNVTSCTVKNFALDANAKSRASVDGCGGGMDTGGTNWRADSIWTQHTMSGFWASGTGGIVQICRLTSIWADGCNVNNVSLGGSVGENLTVANNFVRGTGDDAIAINSVNYNGTTPYTPMSDVAILNNTSIGMWGGKGVAVYGGSGHLVQNNFMSDTARYIGLGVGKFGVNGSDLVSATVIGNVVVRCGGNAYVQKQPALHIGNGGDGQSSGNVGGVTVAWNTVNNSLYNGVGFSTSNNIVFKNNTINSPGLDGIVISPANYPAPTGSATITANTVTGLKAGRTAYSKLSSGYVATVTGNSWQGGSTPAAPAIPPDAPAKVTAIVSLTAVALSWPPVTGAESYTVRRATNIDGPYTAVTANFIGTTVPDSGLTAGTQYFYTVSAVNAFGESAASAKLAVLAYAPPANIALANKDNPPSEGAAQAFDGSTNTKWYSNGGPTGWLQYYFGATAKTVIRYDLTSGNDSPSRDPESWQFQGSHNGTAWTTLDTQTGQTFAARRSTRQFAIGNTTAYEYYRLNITANNGDSTSLQLAEMAFAFNAPSAPLGLTATAGNAQVVLSWNPVSDATGYQVRRGTASGGPYTDLPVAASTNLTDTGVVNGTPYFYVVAAILAGVTGENSAPISATPQPSPPPAPTALTATAGNAQVTLSWTASAGATGYIVKRGTTSGGPYTAIANPATPGSIDASAVNGTTYYYIVTATNAGGQSATSPQASATPNTALDAWRLANFGSLGDSRAALTADPDADGRSNLLEYAVGSSPIGSDTAAPAALGTTAGGTQLTLTFHRIADPSLTYEVRAADDLGAEWTTIWSSSGAQNTAGSVTITDEASINAQPSRFLRLDVSVSPAIP